MVFVEEEKPSGREKSSEQDENQQQTQNNQVHDLNLSHMGDSPHSAIPAPLQSITVTVHACQNHLLF